MDEQYAPNPEERPEESAGARSRAGWGAAPQPTPPPAFVPSRRAFPWGPFLGGTAFGCGCLPWLGLLLLGIFIAGIGGGAERGPSGDSVGIISVSGVITSGAPDGGGLFGGGGADAQSIISQLERARENRRIKAVVLYINSPGGSAAGSDAVYQEVRKVRADGIPVAVSMGDVAASGGYYIASAADRIFANGATTTGSIGVIASIPNFSDPNGWIHKSGYDEVVIKSGKFKDMGNPFRPVTAAEKDLFQQMINDIYNQFLSAVSKGRNMPMARLKPLADGRAYTGRQAVKNGLVDEIGGLDDAVAYAAKKAGMGANPKIYKFGGSPIDRLLGDTGVLSQSLMRRSPLELLLLDPRAQAVAQSLNAAR